MPAKTKKIDGITVISRRHPNAPSDDTPCAWARWLLRQPEGFVVWDTETTGLEHDSKIVSIGAVDQEGNILLDLLLNPGVPIPPDATEIHGITDEMVKDAPTFEQAYPEIRRALHGQRWVIYNASYDMPRLRYECDRAYLPLIEPLQNQITKELMGTWTTWERPQGHCAMEAFAVKYGSWHDYFQSYTWQSLASAAHYYRIPTDSAHHALSDALTTLAVVRRMALSEDRKVKEPKVSERDEMG